MPRESQFVLFGKKLGLERGLVIWLRKVRSIIPINYACVGMSTNNHLNDIHGLTYGHLLRKCMSLYIIPKLWVE